MVHLPHPLVAHANNKPDIRLILKEMIAQKSELKIPHDFCEVGNFIVCNGTPQQIERLAAAKGVLMPNLHIYGLRLAESLVIAADQASTDAQKTIVLQRIRAAIVLFRLEFDDAALSRAMHLQTRCDIDLITQAVGEGIDQFDPACFKQFRLASSVARNVVSDDIGPMCFASFLTSAAQIGSPAAGANAAGPLV